MKPSRVILALFLGLATASLHAQTLTAGPVACGPVSTNLSCLQIPLQFASDDTGAGTVDINLGPSAQFLKFFEGYGTAKVDTATAWGGLVSSVIVTFHGVDVFGHDYTGTGTLYFIYRKSQSKYGGYTRLCTGGTFTINPQL